MKARCRHERHSWLLAGARIEWCYVCGAWRKLKAVSTAGALRGMPEEGGENNR